MSLFGRIVGPLLRRMHPKLSALQDMHLAVDDAWYSAIYPDVAATGLSAADHFAERGAWEGRRPNRVFDPIWYVQRYADAAGQHPVLHYAQTGRRKHYDPGPTFSSEAYLEVHKDVAASGMDPLDHYIRHGQHENRTVRPADSSAINPSAIDLDGSRRAFIVPQMSDDELPGREMLARVQEMFAERNDAGPVGAGRATVVNVPAPDPAPAPVAQVRGSPFWFYNCLLNAEGTILRHARKDLTADPRYLTNFIGVKLDPRLLSGLIDGREGQIEAPPLPSNWHADLTEWTAVLRAVDLAGSNFVMAELGCGWGCWMSNAGAAARQTERSFHLIGVEGDKDRVASAREILAINGFEPNHYTLHHAVAAARAGIALFPRRQKIGRNDDAEPILDASPEQRDALTAAGSHDALEMLPLSCLLTGEGKLDLLHIGIKRDAADYVSESLADLNAKAAYLVITTPSREIEGRLFATLRHAGWRLEIERPAYIHLDPISGPKDKIDGAQGWRNMKLLPD